MGKTTSERVSVKAHHLPYLKSFGASLGTHDLSEIVNHILNCHRLGCNLPPSQSSTTAQSTNSFAPKTQRSDDEELADVLGDMLAA